MAPREGPGHSWRELLLGNHSHDAHTLAIGNYDNTVHLWELTTPQHPIFEATLTGHTGGVSKGDVQLGRTHPGHREL
jgi:WD40 repeat protein